MAKPFKMKGSPMQRNFGIGSPLKKEDVVSDTSPGAGYKKIKGTNIWEHIPTKEQKRKDRESTKAIATQAGWKTNTLGEVTGKIDD